MYVVDALKRWEPRIVITSVAVRRQLEEGENVLAVRIRYDVVTTTAGTNIVKSGIEQTIVVSRVVR